MNEKLPRLSVSLPISLADSGIPTAPFHISWQKVVEAIERLQVSGAGSLILDGGSASSGASPSIIINGGSA